MLAGIQILITDSLLPDKLNCQGLRVPQPIYDTATQYFEKSELRALCGETLKPSPYNPDIKGLISIDFLRFTVKKSFYITDEKTGEQVLYEKASLEDVCGFIDTHFPCELTAKDLQKPTFEVQRFAKSKGFGSKKKVKTLANWQPARGKEWHEKELRNPVGISVMWTDNQKYKNYGTFHVIVPGKALRCLPFFKQIELLKDMFCRGYKPTRIDGAIDVFDRSLLNIDDIESAAYSKDYCYVKDAQIVESFEKGKTVYFGSRKSSKYARFYDASAKHCLQLKKALKALHDKDLYWLRSEFQLGKQAPKEFCRLCIAIYESIVNQPHNPSEPFHYRKDECYREMVNLFKSFLCVTVDFRKKGSAYIDERPRLDWWSKFLDDVDSIDIKKDIQPYITPVEKAQRWINKQVAKTICGLRIYYQDDGRFWQYIQQVCEDVFISFAEKPDYLLDRYCEKWKFNTG